MTKEEITEITKHIEIHARREPRAIHTTEILRKAVLELVLLQEENAELKKKNLNAKEIIKKLMVFAEIDNREYEEAYKEAEQFLKETK